VDLTSVTTSASVQQLRGRTIRLDPSWPRKLAHNWDVICVETGFDRGDGDLRRFLRRHDRTWGLTPPASDEDLVSGAVRRTLGDARGPEAGGQVVRGVAHVDDGLAFGLAIQGWKRFDYGAVNRRMLAEIGRRDRSYELWRVGEEYRDVTGAACRVDPSDLRIRTVHTISETLTRMIRQFAASVAVGLGIVLYFLLTGSLEALESGAPLDSLVVFVAGVLVVGLVLVVLLNARAAWRIARAVLREQPVDSILLDVGSAVVEALREAGLVSRGLRAENVVAEQEPDGSFWILLERATAADAERFVRAYREVFEPVRDQRYLILRDDGRLPFLSGLWRLLRVWFRSAERYAPAYHPVPDVLATRRERADAYARHWARFVGGGQLIHTRSEQGRKVLLEARAQRRPNVKGLAFETWR
jgi:hypothetical protein